MSSLISILFTITFFLLSHNVCAQILRGKVIRIADGDTITLLDSANIQIRVRLYGIDCPENGQDFAKVAKQFTSELCFAKTVTVDVMDTDRYGRTVGIVWTPDSINVNSGLLREGLAWHCKHFDKSEEFAQAEHLARGLWIQSNVVAPWDYRRNRK